MKMKGSTKVIIPKGDAYNPGLQVMKAKSKKTAKNANDIIKNFK